MLHYESGKNLGIKPFYISHQNDLTPERFEELPVFLFELFASEIKVAKVQSVSIKKILHHYYISTFNNHSLEGFYDFIEKNQKNLLKSLNIHPDYFNVTSFLHIMSE